MTIDIESGPGGLTWEVYTPLPSNAPHDPMLLRADVYALFPPNPQPFPSQGWSVPDIVNFQMRGALVGNWEPYPIDMSFHAPCVTLSTIGLARPGQVEEGLRSDQCPKHLYQMHVCLPAKEGHTRLLYRMALDFMPWVQFVPFINGVWQQMANQVCTQRCKSCES